jgi:hypothetical protein
MKPTLSDYNYVGRSRSTVVLASALSLDGHALYLNQVPLLRTSPHPLPTRLVSLLTKLQKVQISQLLRTFTP